MTVPLTPVINPLEFQVFNILGTNFLVLNEGCHHKNQHV